MFVVTLASHIPILLRGDQHSDETSHKPKTNEQSRGHPKVLFWWTAEIKREVNKACADSGEG
jgi:hypothetical protein